MSEKFSMSEFRSLLDSYLDGTLQPDRLSDFEAYLKEEEYRDIYIKLVHQDSVLYQLLEKVEIKEKAPVRTSFILKTAIAAFILLSPLLFFMFSSGKPQQSFAPFTVSNTANCTWVRDAGENDKFIELRSGVAKLLFEDGSAVIIEAPVKFRQIGTNKIFLDDGNIYVKGKPEFTVLTEKYKIVDIGTEFGVAIEEETRIQVHKGKVSVSKDSALNLDLTKGQAVISDSDKLSEAEFINSYFLRDIPSAPENVRMLRNAHFPGTVPYNINKYERYEVHQLTDEINIDGKLDEWDKTHNFTSACRSPFADSHNISGQIRYSDKGLYAAFRVNAPNPMMNKLALSDPGCWNAGSQQLWLSKGNDRICLTMLYSDLSKESHLLKSVNDGNLEVLGKTNFQGKHFLLSGSAYSLEYFIPFKTLGFEVNEGEKISIHLTSHWGDKSGKYWNGFLEEFQNFEYFNFDRKNTVTWGYAEFK
ncbi:MAG: FecR family protein [Lentisphaeraceae bacterium]|nr:FecR family protein [Lentisphaeraceae bacterium]